MASRTAIKRATNLTLEGEHARAACRLCGRFEAVRRNDFGGRVEARRVVREHLLTDHAEAVGHGTPLEHAEARRKRIDHLGVLLLEGRVPRLVELAAAGQWNDDLAHIEKTLRELLGLEG